MCSTCSSLRQLRLSSVSTVPRLYSQSKRNFSGSLHLLKLSNGVLILESVCDKVLFMWCLACSRRECSVQKFYSRKTSLVVGMIKKNACMSTCTHSAKQRTQRDVDSVITSAQLQTRFEAVVPAEDVKSCCVCFGLLPHPA